MQDGTEYLVETSEVPLGAVHSDQFSIAGWQMEHDDLWVLARAFSEVEALSRERISLDLWRTGAKVTPNLFISASWIQAAIIANHRRDEVSATFFIQADDSGDLYRRFLILASMDDVRKFGIELEAEIRLVNPMWATDHDA